MKKMIIIGGGISGLCTAIALQRIGMEVKVYERYPHFKPAGAGILLAQNALNVLKRLEIEHEVIKYGKMVKNASVLSSQGNMIFQTDSSNDNLAIHRADLHHVLFHALKPHTVEFNKRCVDFQQNSKEVRVYFEDGSTAKSDFLIAADGIHSLIRQKLLPKSKLREAGHTCWRGVTSDYPDNFNECFTETWGPKGRFGIVPLTKNRIYWFAVKKEKFTNKRMTENPINDLLENFNDYHSPIPQILQLAKGQRVITNTITDLKPIRKFAFDKILLIGDAAHATTPNMGQGACQGIEDSLVLASCLKKSDSPESAFKEFEKIRRKRTHKIVNTSWKIGKMAHLEDPITCRARNFLLRNIPAAMKEKQFKFLFDIEFEQI